MNVGQTVEPDGRDRLVDLRHNFNSNIVGDAGLLERLGVPAPGWFRGPC
jgi:hypothetical protein